MSEPKIDYFINRYFETVARDPLNPPNTFDYRAVDYQDHNNMINSFRFSGPQMIANGRMYQHFKDHNVHPMFMHVGLGSLTFKPTFHSACNQVKIYPELVHEVLSVVKRQTLDDMPKTIQTMDTRLIQLKKL